jgi:hypothetical protein
MVKSPRRFLKWIRWVCRDHSFAYYAEQIAKQRFVRGETGVDIGIPSELVAGRVGIYSCACYADESCKAELVSGEVS